MRVNQGNLFLGLICGYAFFILGSSMIRTVEDNTLWQGLVLGIVMVFSAYNLAISFENEDPKSKLKTGGKQNDKHTRTNMD